jgi:beta-lactam-binding protein with PASTA domain
MKDAMRRRVGGIVRPDREFGELRDIAERRRSPTWQVTIALIAGTIGAAALGYLAVQLFFLPETIREASLNRVPDLTGLGLEDAAERGEDAGYVVLAAGRDYSDDVDRGEVIYQDPPPDMYLPRGDTLRVLVSLGETEERVPDVAGLELELARQVFAGMSLPVTGVRREPSDVHPQGTVIRTEPAAGTAREEDTAVTVILSRGGSRLTLPSVEGLSLAQARDTLEVYSLMVGEVTSAAEGEAAPPEGARIVVVKQDPGAGWLVPAGSAVNLTLGPAAPPRREAPVEEPADALEGNVDEAPAEPAEIPAEEVPTEDEEFR